MRQASRLLLGAAFIAGTLANTGAARAQVDINPPPPNVMLLIDSSGSMEYLSSSTSFPVCDPTKDNASEKSRWVELTETLTGSIDKYRCQAVDRSSSAFLNEFKLSGQYAPDAYYTNPYHRLLSEKCTPGAGVLPANPFAWPATDAIKFHKYDNIDESCDFKQDDDGLLDNKAFRKVVRFGLMTFDSLTNAGTGWDPGPTANYGTGTTGAWSYYLSSPAKGKPDGCDKFSDQEVGARNGAAPPWEGRLMTFGAPSAPPENQNDRIQQVLLATRPFGATPIAGMLDDVRQFLWNDTSKDPTDSSKDYGPYNDPYIQGGCRKNFVLLMSDGEPNLDLRPWCSGPNCPYQKPEEIAFDLANAADTKKKTQVFVIGFAVSNVTLSNATVVDCKKLTVDQLTKPGDLCSANPNESQLQACCVLSRIAYNGGTDRAFFATDKDELRAAFSAVLSGIAASTTSRTLPVFASVPGGASGTGPAGFRFYTSFKPKQFDLWQGVLERQRILCQPDSGTVQPKLQNLDKTKGDDFVWNVNSGKGPKRMFWTVVGDLDGGKIWSNQTIRPNISGDVDGAGDYKGSVVWGEAEPWVQLVPPAALNVDAGTCKGLTAPQCRDRFLRWLTGADTTSVYSRCKAPGTTSCNLVGDIFHSTPRVVNKPDELLRDESYEIHALKRAKRHSMLYTATNDGFLHGFKVASGDPATDTLKVDTDDNNELWAFVPPAVLYGIPGEYPPTHQTLLDGVPVVQDVIAVENPAGSGKFKFERTAVAARGGQGQWRTIMVSSFGPSDYGGYFAIDITDPVVPTDPNDPTKGPKFLWQLVDIQASKKTGGERVFGRGGATPLITTLFFDDGTGAKEVAVAVLPGGDDIDPKDLVPVNRKDTSPADVDTNFPPRTQIPKYKDDDKNHGSRSLTVVRLDTGEIIRSFRANAAKAGKLKDKGRVIEVPIDSPISGVPVAFPGTTGSVADRIFVGDKDGTLWRVDVASSNPDNWKMKLFFDAYSGKAWDAGQAIHTAPVLSVDQKGNVTVAFSTGDQDVLLGEAGQRNFVYSLTEQLNAAGTAFESKANWFVPFNDAERVTGPMTLFNGALYFTSYKPEPAISGVACGNGTSRVWGMDYIIPETPGSTPATLGDGGLKRLPDGSGNFKQFLDNTNAMLANAGIIFGVGVAQMPSCTEESSGTDTFTGSGTHTSISSVTPGTFQLIMQTSGTGNTNDNTQTNKIVINIPTPPSTSRIDSWAALVE